MDGYYVVPSELPVSSWRPVSGILTAIELECYEGRFSLSKESATWLSEKGYLPFEEVINTSSRMQDVRKASEGSDESELSDMSEGHSKVSEGYYEVEQIVDRRINPATQAFEYLVRFKGYSECTSGCTSGGSVAEWLERRI